MKSYIGTKIINAKTCCKESFDHQKEHNFDGSIPESSGHDTPGYMVVYSNPDGSKYRSWSPKDVFERAYREISEDEAALIINTDE